MTSHSHWCGNHEKVEVMFKSCGKLIPVEEAERKGWVKVVRCSICGNIAGCIDKTKRPEVKEIALPGMPPINGKQLRGLKEELAKMQRYCPWCGAPISLEVK